MTGQAEKLKEEADEIRADLGNPEITDEERVTLQNIIDQMEAALMPLAELSDELAESSMEAKALPWWKRILRH